MLTPLSSDKWTRKTADHLLNRAAFGESPSAREELYQLGRTQGVQAAIDSLVNPSENWSSTADPEWSTEEDPNGDIFGNSSERRYDLVRWYLSMLKDAQPLAAKLLKFFVDHFSVNHNTSRNETRFMYFIRFLKLLRKHAAGDLNSEGNYGKFSTLVNQVSWSEAMIDTLDLDTSSASEINENFGRELLELFTMGVHGGYTENDVGAAAEAFTGRRLYRMQSPHPEASQINENWLAPLGTTMATSYQDTSRQDLLPKTFLNQSRMPDRSTIADGDDILELIFNDIECSKHLVWKLWRYFVSPEIDDTILTELATRFRDEYQYDVRLLLNEVFMSETFYSESVMGSQIKDSGDMFISLLKKLEMDLPPARSCYTLCERLNYNPLFPPNIAGWPEPEAQGNGWMGSGSLLFRINMPSIWVQGNYDALDDWNSRNEMIEAEQFEIESIIPRELWESDNFPLLIAKLSDRFIPTVSLRKSQIRIFYDRFQKTAQYMDTQEAVKETLRLFLALPEFQMQ
ncbi:DUF1800 domain-containing protein [Puniceicoccaceae bacterium K14]|nr:DUF1800 domain-containing protein [Puniceicoccaceae bacterium K14]